MLVSTTAIFQNVFNQSVGIAGTNFVAMGASVFTDYRTNQAYSLPQIGLGFFAASQGGARLLDPMYRKLKAHYGTEGKPEYRLPFQFPAAVLMPLGLLMYGWGAERRVHWLLVDFGMGIVAFSMIL